MKEAPIQSVFNWLDSINAQNARAQQIREFVEYRLNMFELA